MPTQRCSKSYRHGYLVLSPIGAMAYDNIKTKDGRSIHSAGHTMGDFGKKTSIGNGYRKKGSFKRNKKYRGQGRG